MRSDFRFKWDIFTSPPSNLGSITYCSVCKMGIKRHPQQHTKDCTAFSSELTFSISPPSFHLVHSLNPFCVLPPVCHPHWVKISFESKKVKLLSCVRLFAIPWTVADQAPSFMEFFRQDYWSGLPFPSSGDPPNQGIEPRSPTLRADILLSEPPGK